MKKFLLYVFFAYIALTVQSVFFKGVKPDFVLVLVCIYSLKYGYKSGMTYGILSGLLIDTNSGFILGPNIISKTTAVFLTRTARDNIFNWNIVSNTLLVSVLSVIDIFTVKICQEIFTGMSFSNMPWRILLTESLYTILAAIILYVLFKPDAEDMPAGIR